jgi:hypothetical protein
MIVSPADYGPPRAAVRPPPWNLAQRTGDAIGATEPSKTWSPRPIMVLMANSNLERQGREDELARGTPECP